MIGDSCAVFIFWYRNKNAFQEAQGRTLRKEQLLQVNGLSDT